MTTSVKVPPMSIPREQDIMSLPSLQKAVCAITGDQGGRAMLWIAVAAATRCPEQNAGSRFEGMLGLRIDRPAVDQYLAGQPCFPAMQPGHRCLGAGSLRQKRNGRRPRIQVLEHQ